MRLRAGTPRPVNTWNLHAEPDELVRGLKTDKANEIFLFTISTKGSEPQKAHVKTPANHIGCAGVAIRVRWSTNSGLLNFATPAKLDGNAGKSRTK